MWNEYILDSIVLLLKNVLVRVPSSAIMKTKVHGQKHSIKLCYVKLIYTHSS